MTDIITLIDEDDHEHQFEIEAVLDVDNQKYAVLIPLDEEYSNSNEAIIMKFAQDEKTGEEILFDIEDDDEWNNVADAYDQIIDEEDADFDMSEIEEGNEH